MAYRHTARKLFLQADTLQLKRPFGQTIWITLLILGLLLGMAEIVMRQPLVQARLTAPSLNSRHRQFEVQWHRLETLARSGEPITCIALGNSMLWRGFDPAAVQQGYRSQTGETLRCFNFGVDALSPAAAGVLAPILVETYRPQLLIFGTDARDFSVSPQDEDVRVILEMAWIQHHSGRFNPTGWLIEHSYLYRYRYHLTDILKLFFRDAVRQKWDTAVQQYGFDADDTVGTFVTTPPNPNDDSYHVQYYYRLLRNYTIREENQTGLAQILTQQSNGLVVVVVEMPVPETYFTFFDDAPADYQAFIETLTTASTAHQVPFWESTAHDLIPDNGWVDYTHLNSDGARLFSQWLGQRLGEAVMAGHLTGHSISPPAP